MLSHLLWLPAIVAVTLLPPVLGRAPPVNYGIVVYPAFTSLDVFGPLNILHDLSQKHQMNLSIIASTLKPVSTETNATYNPAGSHFTHKIVPTHTFKHPPKDLDVLIVPGGAGTFYEPPAMLDVIEFIRETYPRLQYIISVCSGSTLLARAGVLDGKRATTNKAVWSWAVSQGPKVDWVPVARWVTDGNIWTTSGVTAGMDGTLAFVDMLYGENVTTALANREEYERHTNSSWDPFAKIWNVPGSS